jgi:hypothetical protein
VTRRRTYRCNQPRGVRGGFPSCAPTVPSATDGSVSAFARAYLAPGGSASQLSVQSRRQRRRKADTRLVRDVIRTAIGILANDRFRRNEDDENDGSTSPGATSGRR